jgi:hypothetical protein
MVWAGLQSAAAKFPHRLQRTALATLMMLVVHIALLSPASGA